MKMAKQFLYDLILVAIPLLAYDRAVSQLPTVGSYVWNGVDSPKVFNSELQLSFVNSTTGFPDYGTVLAGGGLTKSQDGGAFQIYFPYNIHYGGNAPRIRFGLYNNQGWSAWSMFFTSANANLPTVTWTTKDLIAYGNVLIGKTSQTNTSYKLDVNGNIRANKVVVNTTGADYVFDSSYHLLCLDSLNSFVEANHHLPGIEPAGKMQLHGLNLADAYTKLLEKTEELTLYIIELNKEIGLRDKEIEKLRAMSTEFNDIKKRFDILEQSKNKQVYANKCHTN